MQEHALHSSFSAWENVLAIGVGCRYKIKFHVIKRFLYIVLMLHASVRRNIFQPGSYRSRI